MKLLIATTNPGKIWEYGVCFQSDGIEVLSLKDFPGVTDVEETGATYLENAMLKAKASFTATGVPALGDDGGLEIDCLDGFPGLHSKRWIGGPATAYEYAVAIIEKMRGVPIEHRGACLRAVVAFWDGKELLTGAATITGFIPQNLTTENIQQGFPYRSILFIPGYNKLYSDVTDEEHLKISHRVKIVNELRPKILASLRAYA